LVGQRGPKHQAQVGDQRCDAAGAALEDARAWDHQRARPGRGGRVEGGLEVGGVGQAVGRADPPAALAHDPLAHDLWQLLVLLTARKAVNLRQHERRQKRGGGRVVAEADLGAEGTDEEAGLAGALGDEPTPAFAAQVAEECRRLLGRLGDDGLRALAVARMEGHTTEELAARFDVAPRTIERRLRKIRALWSQEVAP
jgi:hypothetical protein